MPTAEEIRNEANIIQDQIKPGLDIDPVAESEMQKPDSPLPDPPQEENYAPFFTEEKTMRDLKTEDRLMSEMAQDLLMTQDIVTRGREYEDLQMRPLDEITQVRKDLIDIREQERQLYLEKTKPSFREQVTAFLEEENFLSALVAMGPRPTFEPDPSYTPFNDPMIQGYEAYSSLWYLSTSPQETIEVIRRINKQKANKDAISRSSTPTMVFSSLVAGFGSPLNLAAMVGLPATVANTTSTLGRVAYGVGTGLTITATEEVLLHQVNDLRTLEDSKTNIVASVLLDTTLGATAAAYGKSVGLYDQARADSFEYLARGGPEQFTVNDFLQQQRLSAGTPDVIEIDSSGVKWTDPLRKILFMGALQMSKITPLGKLLQSDSPTARQLALELMETEIEVTSQRGIHAVESLVNRDINETTEMILKSEEIIKQARKRHNISELQFYEMLDNARRHGDTHDYPEVQRVAEMYRKRLDDLYTRAAEAGVPHTYSSVMQWDDELKKMVEVERVPLSQTTSESYARRLYNQMEVVRRKPEFYQALEQGLEANRVKMEADIGAKIQQLNRENKTEIKQAETTISGTPSEIKNLKSTLRNKESAIKANSRKIGQLQKGEGNEAQIKDLHAKIRQIEKSKKIVNENIKKLEADLKAAREYMVKHRAKIKDLKERIPPKLDPDELLTYQDAYYEKVTGLHAGDLNIGIEPTVSIFKHRQPIDDVYLETFLVKNARDEILSLTRQLSPRIHLQEKFGSIELTEQIQRVHDDLTNRINNVDNAARAASGRDKSKLERQSKRLRGQQKDLVRTLNATRDRLLARVNKLHGAKGRTFGQSLGRSLLYFNIMTKLAGQLISSLPETGKLIARYGFTPFAKVLARDLKQMMPFVRQLPEDRASRLAASASRAAVIRPAQTFEVYDDVPTTKFERLMQIGANITQVISLQKFFDQTFRGMAGTLAADGFARAIKKGDVDLLAKRGFTSHEIDVMRNNIQHMQEADGLIDPNVYRWRLPSNENFNGQAFLEKYETMLVKESNFTIIKPGIGDRPVFMDDMTWRIIFQFKSFVIAATNRTMLPATQRASTFYKHTLIQGALGILGYMIYEASKGKEPDLSASNIAWQGLLRGGFLGYATDVAAITNRVAGVLPQASRYQNRNWMGSIFGPSYGMAEDIFKIANLYRDDQGNFATGADSRMRAIRKLIPWQNHWAIRQPLDHVEGAAARAFGGTGKYADKKEDYINSTWQ